jgi:hypothetical protein
MCYTLMLASYVYNKQKIWKIQDSISPWPRRLGCVFWPLDVMATGRPARRRVHVAWSGCKRGAHQCSDNDLRCGVATSALRRTVIQFQRLVWSRELTMVRCWRPFALIWGITLSFDLCRELKRGSLWVTALAAINASWALGCFASSRGEVKRRRRPFPIECTQVFLTYLYSNRQNRRVCPGIPGIPVDPHLLPPPCSWRFSHTKCVFSTPPPPPPRPVSIILRTLGQVRH